MCAHHHTANSPCQSTEQQFQCGSLGWDLLLIPLVIKQNLFTLSNVSLGYGETYPLQIAVLTEEVTAAQCHMPLRMVCMLHIAAAQSETSTTSSSSVGSRSLLTQLLLTAAGYTSVTWTQHPGLAPFTASFPQEGIHNTGMKTSTGSK